MSLPIETERLWLRKYRNRDLGDILEFSLNADYWLYRNLDWDPTLESVRAFWQPMQDVDPASDPKWLQLVVELKAEGKVVGSVGIGVIKNGDHRQGTIGWLLGQRYRGQGFATEAAAALLTFGFEVMDLHRISARTGSDNERSWRLMERLGMRREAHFVESHTVQGVWRDEFVYAILASEWEESHVRTRWR
jgi:RimJ/RimL family protein N-acetyltransferase